MRKALSDDPCCLFIDELLSAYPNAKVILTTRNRAAWLHSMQRFILEILSWRSMRLLSYLDPEFTGPYQALLNRATTVLSQGRPPCAPSSNPAGMTGTPRGFPESLHESQRHVITQRHKRHSLVINELSTLAR